MLGCIDCTVAEKKVTMDGKHRPYIVLHRTDTAAPADDGDYDVCNIDSCEYDEFDSADDSDADCKAWWRRSYGTPSSGSVASDEYDSEDDDEDDSEDDSEDWDDDEDYDEDNARYEASPSRALLSATQILCVSSKEHRDYGSFSEIPTLKQLVVSQGAGPESPGSAYISRSPGGWVVRTSMQREEDFV